MAEGEPQKTFLAMPPQSDNAEGTIFEGSSSPRSNAGVLKYVPQSGEDVVVVSKKAVVGTKEAVGKATEAGLFNYFKDFGLALVMPMPKEQLLSKEVMMEVAQGKHKDLELGFIFANVGVFWADFFGALMGGLFGAGIVGPCFEVLFSAVVAYMLYFMVTKSPTPNHTKWAFWFYLAFTALTLLAAWGSLMSGVFFLAGIFYTVKTALCAVAAIYAFKLFQLKQGAEVLPESV